MASPHAVCTVPDLGETLHPSDELSSSMLDGEDLGFRTD